MTTWSGGGYWGLFSNQGFALPDHLTHSPSCSLFNFAWGRWHEGEQPGRKLCLFLLEYCSPLPTSGISSLGPWTSQHWSPSISPFSRRSPHFQDLFSMQELQFHSLRPILLLDIPPCGHQLFFPGPEENTLQSKYMQKKDTLWASKLVILSRAPVLPGWFRMCQLFLIWVLAKLATSLSLIQTAGSRLLLRSSKLQFSDIDPLHTHKSTFGYCCLIVFTI